MLRYAREVAFATAEVYARAAEVRGAWDARLEALVVDAVLRAEADEAVLSRASALGWSASGDVAVVLGAAPAAAHRDRRLRRGTPRRPAPRAWTRCAPPRATAWSWCSGGSSDADEAAAAVRRPLRRGSGRASARSPTDLAGAHLSARGRAVRRTASAAGWPDAPRRSRSDDLLPERALAGDGHARRHLVDEIYLPLLQARGTLIETLAAYFDHGGSIEGTGRALFVHPNTVRYRLRQVAELTGLTPDRATRTRSPSRSRWSWAAQSGRDRRYSL